MPNEKVSGPLRTVSIQRQKLIQPSRSDQSRVRRSAGTMYSAQPTSIEATKPKTMVLTWLGRVRPKTRKKMLLKNSGAAR